VFAFDPAFDSIPGENGMHLELCEKFPGNDVELPFYWYDIYVNDTPVGKISIRIGENYHAYYNGHIGYEIDPPYRGHHYSLAAVRLVLPVARRHGMRRVLLTCDASNAASRRTIELTGAKLLEIAEVPRDYFAWREGMEPQCIFALELPRIIWINGPYGVGKSTLAAYLHRCHPNSFVFDAEAVGNLVRDHRPDPMYNGAVFEDYPRWFDVCVLLLGDMAAGYDGDIYVPMTLIRRDSFSRFAAPLRARGIEVRQVLLVSDRNVVHDRILARGEDETCWCMQQIDLCLACQADMDDAVRIRSDGASVEELGAEVERFLR
jgi:tagatose 1,6-diphosphate aldolase